MMTSFSFFYGDDGLTAMKLFLLVSPVLALWLLIAGWVLWRGNRPRQSLYLWLSLMMNLAFCAVLLSCLSSYYVERPQRRDWMPVLVVIPSLMLGVINVFLLRHPRKP